MPTLDKNFRIVCYTSAGPFLPNINDKINNTTNRKNINLAMPAAPAAIPPNPNIAATIATIRNINVQRNIELSFYDE